MQLLPNLGIFTKYFLDPAGNHIVVGDIIAMLIITTDVFVPIRIKDDVYELESITTIDDSATSSSVNPFSNTCGRKIQRNWKRDDTADFCESCEKKFHMFNRKHHCRWEKRFFYCVLFIPTWHCFLHNISHHWFDSISIYWYFLLLQL